MLYKRTTVQPKDFDRLVLSSIPSGSRILVAEAWDATPHLETGLEIALRLAKGYSEVAYLHYGDILPACEFSSRPRLRRARRLAVPNKTPAQKGIRIAKDYASLCGSNLTVLDVSDFPLPDDYILEPESLASLESLRKTCFCGDNIFGISLVSSLVSLTGNSIVNPGDHESLVGNLAIGFARCFSLISTLLDDRGYDALVVFNGRFASVKGAVLAANRRSKPVFFHERGSSAERFTIRDYQPHERTRLQAEMRDLWNHQKHNPSALSTAESFFLSQRDGKEQGWVSFKEGMTPGASSLLISQAKARLKSNKGKLICFFSSSEDEYVSTEGFFESSGFEWKSQDEACKALISAVEKYGHSLVIRNHPHLRLKSVADREKWDSLEFIDDHSNIMLIKSDSVVDSYELIDACDLVVVYGSTVGIEAVYWNKPVIVMSDTLYDEIGASIYKPLSVDNLHSLVGNIDKLSVEPQTALAYGHYMSTFGTPFQLYQPESLFKGKFLGVNLNQRSIIRRLASKIYGFLRPLRSPS